MLVHWKVAKNVTLKQCAFNAMQATLWEFLMTFMEICRLEVVKNATIIV